MTVELGARVPPKLKDNEAAGRIVDGLSPTHPIRTNVAVVTEVPVVPVLTAEELSQGTTAMNSRKAPEPDGVPAEILWLMVRLRPEILLDLYNTCSMTEGFGDC